MFQERKAQVEARVAHCVKLAVERLGATMPKDLHIRFDLKGRAAGMAGVKWGQYFVRFNTQMMLNDSWDHLINDTVPHEVAHIVCYANPQLGSRHDPGWKRVCRALGGSGERCHSEEVVYAKGKTFRYTTTNGFQVTVSERIHRKIQAGATYTWRGGRGSVTRVCDYELIGVRGQMVKGAAPKQPAPAAPVAKPVKPAAKPMPAYVANRLPAGASKADAVRSQIAIAKREGHGVEYVVAWAVVTLGMSRTLARTYVKNNWSKV